MKTTIITISKEIKFPCIAKYKRDELVVLFKDKTTGIALIETKNISVGYYSDNWEPVTNNSENGWEIINEITINFKA